MRVISGKARGLKLKSPNGLETRPTIDRIKESLFNIIMPYLNQANFLDIFGGSGAIGIEALSRGAKSATFIEISKENADLINYNLTKANFIQSAKIIHSDYVAGINQLINQKFDIIFMDPPYNKNFVENTLLQIVQKDILAPKGIIICEQHIDDNLSNINSLHNFRVKEYKTTKMVFYEKS